MKVLSSDWLRSGVAYAPTCHLSQEDGQHEAQDVKNNQDTETVDQNDAKQRDEEDLEI